MNVKIKNVISELKIVFYHTVEGLETVLVTAVGNISFSAQWMVGILVSLEDTKLVASELTPILQVEEGISNSAFLGLIKAGGA